MLWWVKKYDTEDEDDYIEGMEMTGYLPFVLKYARNGKQCSLCQWQRKCYGCMIEPSREKIGGMLLHNVIDPDLTFIVYHRDRLAQ